MILHKAKKVALNFLLNNKQFYIFLLLIVSLQICSLNIFMPPWFDEVVFADISRSVALNNKFLLNIHPLSTNNSEVLFYGPIFFYLQAFSIKYFGLSAFLFRLPVYLSGVLSALVLGRIIFLITNSKIYERVFLLLFFTNFLICGSLSCGRMEMMALLFVALSLSFFSKTYHKENSRWLLINGILSGLFFCLALLTTPRSSFLYLLFFVPLLKLFAQGVKKKDLKFISVPIFHGFLSFGIPYLIWYKPHLGNAFEILNYISPAAKTQFSVNNSRIDLNSSIWFLIDIVLLSIILFKKIKVPGYVYGFLAASLIFIKVVIPWSYHHGSIIPFLILTAVLFAFHIKKQTRISFASNFLMVVFCIQALFITAKYIIIWIDSPSRNGKALEQIVKQYIPQKSKVIGNYNYYYACINDSCDFRSIEDNTDIATGKLVPVSKKIDYLMNTYPGEYIIVRNDETGVLQPFLDTKKFKKIANIHIPPGSQNFWERCRTKLGLPQASFYNGFIFMRIAR
jgi:hypothetical protein